jgi:hypothetical protein
MVLNPDRQGAFPTRYHLAAAEIANRKVVPTEKLRTDERAFAAQG